MGSSKAYWFVPNSIVYVQNLGDLSADNFHEVDKYIRAFMQEAYASDENKKVHVFVDCTEMRKLPSIAELEGGRILKYMKEPNCGWTVVVGYNNNPFLAILSRLLTSIMGVDLYMADTLSKGLSIFRQLEPTLDNLPDVQEWKTENLSGINT